MGRGGEGGRGLTILQHNAKQFLLANTEQDHHNLTNINAALSHRVMRGGKTLVTHFSDEIKPLVLVGIYNYKLQEGTENHSNWLSSSCDPGPIKHNRPGGPCPRDQQIRAEPAKTEQICTLSAQVWLQL